jgi:hypothetical protein
LYSDTGALDVSSSQQLPSAETEPTEIIRRTLKCVSYWLHPSMEQGPRPLNIGDAITFYDICVWAGFGIRDGDGLLMSLIKTTVNKTDA